MLLPYYIASLNIEHEYYSRAGEYEPFEGICFADTLELAEDKQLPLFFVEENTDRVKREKTAQIMVVIGNPPYNMGQKNENDNNKNRKYPVVDGRIRETYAKDSKAQLNNQDIRDVINTITSKVVLILGRFTPKRKEVLDAIRDTLRKHDYLPVLFDFDPPQRRDLSETAGILARLSRFVIADLTEPKSIPHELYSLIPDLRNVPFQPLLEASKKEYPMFEAFWSYPWVLPIYRYSDGNLPYLLAALKQDVIDPAEKKVNQLAIEKAKRLLGK